MVRTNTHAQRLSAHMVFFTIHMQVLVIYYSRFSLYIRVGEGWYVQFFLLILKPLKNYAANEKTKNSNIRWLQLHTYCAHIGKRGILLIVSTAFSNKSQFGCSVRRTTPKGFSKITRRNLFDKYFFFIHVNAPTMLQTTQYFSAKRLVCSFDAFAGQPNWRENNNLLINNEAIWSSPYFNPLVWLFESASRVLRFHFR